MAVHGDRFRIVGNAACYVYSFSPFTQIFFSIGKQDLFSARSLFRVFFSYNQPEMARFIHRIEQRTALMCIC